MANWNLPATLPLDKSERMKDEFSGRTYLEATIIEGLKFKTSFNFDLINYNTLDYTNPENRSSSGKRRWFQPLELTYFFMDMEQHRVI